MIETSPAPVKNKAHMTNTRWWMIGLGFIILVVNYMDRSAISYAIGPMKKEFGFNNTDFGLIASAFAVGYLVMTLGGGIIVDRYGARKMWSLAAIAWSAVTAFFAVASGFWHIFILRAMLGITEGPCFPSLTRVVTDWLPMSERARATALGLAAVPLASVIGAPLISHLIIYFGWREMFVILASLGVVWAVVWYFVFRDQPAECKSVSEAELHLIEHDGGAGEAITHAKVEPTTWKFMLFNPSLMANNYAFFSFGYLLFFAVTWLPDYLEQTFALKLKDVGFFLIAPWLTATVLLIAAGFISDWLWKKTGSIRKSRSHVIWICQLISALCFIPVVMAPSLPVAITFISLGLGFGLMPNASFYVLNSDLAKDRAATSLGLMDSFLAAAGILAPLLTGILTNATHNFNSAFLLMIGFTITSVFGIIFFQHPDEQLQRKEIINE